MHHLIVQNRSSALVYPFQQALIGLPVSHVWRGHGSALFIEFGKLQPPARTRRDGTPGESSGELGLMIEWSWRIESGGSILCGSWSDEERWEPTFKQMIGRNVVGLTTFGRLPEIEVALFGDMHVASFMTADGDPAWALFDRRDERLVTLASELGALVIENSTRDPTMRKS